jgi:diguanylate cyclase (GGDEF)-like protein
VRLITRNDTSLTVALIAATVILFRQPLRYVLDFVEDIEGRFQLDLLPALLLLLIVFAFHQYRKWAQARADAVVAAADAEQARKQSHTLQRLMAFGQALANALDRTTLQQVLWKHLPAFAPDHQFWVLVRNGDRWDVVLQDGTGQLRSVEQLERLAAGILRGEPPASARESARAHAAQDACFPMLAADAVVGVLGVGGVSPLTVEQEHLLGAAAAVIAIGVKNMQSFLETRELSLRDGLTGCFNRAYALEAVDAELRRARRTSGPLSILMFDVDHFKAVNDRYGHLRGDELLAAIGLQLGRIMRSTDIRCRYGGDEFLVILPETASLGAQQVADLLRQELANVTTGADDNAMPVTISIGVASAAAGELDAKAFINRADSALYRAKRAGRNRLCVAVPPSMSQPESRPDIGDRPYAMASTPGLTANVG